jgi:DNA-directed RNA polymerase specialized sigma24 family protein
MQKSSSWFTTTHWSIVVAAGDASSPHAREALERLCRCYWYPLYAYVRRQGRSAPDAQDLTQAFFLQMLKHGYFARADPRKGRFRSFLLVALNHFLTNEWHRMRAFKRGGALSFLSWDESRAEEHYQSDAFSTESPDQLFEHRWAITVVDRAVNRLRAEYTDADRSDVFETLKELLTGDRATETYARLAERLSMTEAAVKMTVMRMRRRFGALLREEVGHTIADPAELESELRHLLAALTTSG